MRNISRSLGLVLALATAAPLVGCSNNHRDAPPPPVDDTRGGIEARQMPAPDRPHMSTRGKVVVLAGAAALYYLYKHHQHAAATATGEDTQYYLSKNGRVYYRDAEHRAHWVTPPPGGIQVPASEAADYQQFQGYDNQATGRDLSGLATDDAH